MEITGANRSARCAPPDETASANPAITRPSDGAHIDALSPAAHPRIGGDVAVNQPRRRRWVCGVAATRPLFFLRPDACVASSMKGVSPFGGFSDICSLCEVRVNEVWVNYPMQGMQAHPRDRMRGDPLIGQDTPGHSAGRNEHFERRKAYSRYRSMARF